MDMHHSDRDAAGRGTVARGLPASVTAEARHSSGPTTDGGLNYIDRACTVLTVLDEMSEWVCS